ILLRTEQAFNQLYPAIDAAGQSAGGFLEDYIGRLMNAGKEAQAEAKAWDALKAKIAGDSLSAAVADRQDELNAAREEENRQLQDSIDRFHGYSDALRDFIGMLDGSQLGGLSDSVKYDQARKALTGANAENYEELTTRFLDASMGRSGSRADYRTDVAF